MRCGLERCTLPALVLFPLGSAVVTRRALWVRQILIVLVPVRASAVPSVGRSKIFASVVRGEHCEGPSETQLELHEATKVLYGDVHHWGVTG